MSEVTLGSLPRPLQRELATPQPHGTLEMPARRKRLHWSAHFTPAWAPVYMSPLNACALRARNWVTFFSGSPAPAQPGA